MAEDGNKYLTFYENWYILAEGRDTDEKRLAFYDTIMRYAFDGVEPKRPERGRSHGKDWAAWDAINIVKPMIDTFRKRQEAGRKGGRAGTGAAKDRSAGRAANEAASDDASVLANKPQATTQATPQVCLRENASNKNKNQNKNGNKNRNEKKNINRSVAVRACAREDGDGNGNGNGDGLLIPGGSGSLVALARKFADAVRNDPDNGGGAFFDPAHDPVAMMVALTGDAKSVRRWRQLAAGIPDADLRQELFAAYREIACGEEPQNRAAALNARLGKMLVSCAKKGGEQ